MVAVASVVDQADLRVQPFQLRVRFPRQRLVADRSFQGRCGGAEHGRGREVVPAGAELHWTKLPHENAAAGLAVSFAATAETAPSTPRRHSPAMARLMTRLPNPIIDDAPSAVAPAAPGAHGLQAEDTHGHCQQSSGIALNCTGCPPSDSYRRRRGERAACQARGALQPGRVPGATGRSDTGRRAPRHRARARPGERPIHGGC